MVQVNLPAGDAVIPHEEAYQPETESVHKEKINSVTFALNTQSTDISGSQNSSTYKEVLSQPSRGLSHRARLRWLQQRRTPGLWVQCDDCSRWRYLPLVVDAHELPKLWYCKYNPDKSLADCSKPEVPLRVRDEEDLIHSEYSAGSLVWARLPGWPWWPAMVDDCPETEQYYWLDGFSDIPTHYNVVFFDTFDVTRAWIAPEQLKPYDINMPSLKGKDRKYKKRLDVSLTQANDAKKMTVQNRLAKYSFLTRYPGSINRPKKITKSDLERYQRTFKRKYNIDFPDESLSLSDDDLIEESGDEVPVKKVVKAKNVKTSRKVTKTIRKRKTQDKTKDDINKKLLQETSAESDNTDEESIARVLNKNIKKPRKAKHARNNPKQNISIKKETVKVVKTPKDRNDVPKDDQNAEPETNDVDLTLAETPFSQVNTPESNALGDKEFVKPSNSMAVQIGSTSTELPESVEQSFDNDTSKTYVPPGEEAETETQPSMSDIVKRILNRSSSACSGDFDF